MTLRDLPLVRSLSGAAAVAVLLVTAGLPGLAGAAPPTPSSPLLTYGTDSSPWQQILVDGDDVERDAAGKAYNVFGGFGSVSCNNTSNLLLDYKEENPEAYWKIMNSIFNPRTGAGLRHIKVELGSDTNTSSGAEPATKRSADEPADVLRGAGFHFIADALKINPDIAVEALRWGEPSWTGTDWDKRYQWYKETIDAAYDTFGVKFSYLSPSQNEVNSGYIDAELRWTVELAKRLEADAAKPDARYDYGAIKIVALDSYRNGEAVSAAVLASPDALKYVDTIGIHYTIGGGPNLTRLNKEFGKEVLYSEGIAPMIEPEYRVTADPARGGIGGTVGLVDLADRFINAYRWSGSGDDPAHMTSFLFQPAVSAMYEGSQYSPKSLIRASDPWSGYYEGGAGIAMARHFMQFIDHGWEYIEGASGGDGSFADGGTAVDSSTRTVLTLRTPQASEVHPELTQVHANNTKTSRFFEVKVAALATSRTTPLYVWETTGAKPGEAVDANWFKNPGYIVPVRQEVIDGQRHYVYRIEVKPYSIMTLSTLPKGIHGSAAPQNGNTYAATAKNTPLPLPYTDDFEYADYPKETINGREMSYLERRSGTPRYTADQNGAFEVAPSGDDAHGNVMVQKIHADNRGYTWNVWGNGSQNNVSTATPATVLGDHTWTNYTAAADVRFDTRVRDGSLANVVGIGVRQVVAQGNDLAPYAVRLSSAGAWELRKLDRVVASGTVEGFDANAWHRLSLEADENTFTASLDGAALTTWTDASANPVMAGRISLVSGYYNTQIDNLAVTPIEGRSWSSTKLDDTDASLGYSGATGFNQVGFAHYNRTTHSVRTGGSVRIPFEGTGINLFGASGAARVEVTLDGGAPFQVDVGSTGDRQTSFWLRRLAAGPHVLTVTPVSGTFTLDGVDVVTGGSSTTDPASTPIAVTGSVPRVATAVGTAPSLPRTVTAVSATGEQFEADVDWDTEASSFDTPYEMVLVRGTFAGSTSLTVQAPVEVVPDGLRYLVDANALDTRVTRPADVHGAVEALLAGRGRHLLNGAPDAAWQAGSTWGAVVTGTAKAPLNLPVYDKTRETGYYGNTVSYRFTLPAGSYTVTSGHTEWWNPGAGKSRVISGTISYAGADGAITSAKLGTVTFPNGSLGESRTLRGQFTLTEPTVVTYAAAKDGGTEAATLSWIGVAATD